MANGINVGISLPDSQSVNDTLTAARFIKKSMSRSSLTRMAKDTVMQFPLLISSGIESDEVSVISRALERQYAALMVSSMSINAGVNINPSVMPGSFQQELINSGTVESFNWYGPKK